MVSYRELFLKIQAYSNHLLTAGIGIGDRVGIKRLSGVELLASYYGCMKIGAVPVPLPFHDEERNIGATQAAQINSILDSEVETIDAKLDFSCQTFPEAIVIFTSGTTSSALKGVRIGHKAISSAAHFMNGYMQVDESINELVCASLTHAFGLGRCHSVLAVGGTLTFTDNIFSLGSVLRSLPNNRCNALSTPPSILSSILRISKSNFQKAASNVRWIQTGAMRFDQRFRRELCAALPQTRIFLHYGLTEALRATFFELSRSLNKVHTEGKPSEGLEIRILDDMNNSLPADREGVIALRGPTLCLGYLDKTLWEQSFVNGWFITSDRGYLDDDGYLIFSGRNDDVINRNGILVHPDEIESKLYGLFPNNTISVVGVPDSLKIKDVIVVLCVEGETSIKLADVVKVFIDSDPELIPARFVMMDKFPRTRSGKVIRTEIVRELRDILRDA